MTAANYEARRYGVNSAMPMAMALRRCPNAVVVPVRMRRYAELSAQVMAIFDDMTPLVEPLGIDEAFLDVSGAAKAARLAPRRRGAAARPRARGDGADLLGRRRIDEVRRQTRLRAVQAQRSARRPGRGRRWRSCIRCRSARSGASAPRPRHS